MAILLLDRAVAYPLLINVVHIRAIITVVLEQQTRKYIVVDCGQLPPYPPLAKHQLPEHR